ncbi:DUF3667 domain-containing protein [uncultured Croceitalea sp.]|uniref:DUF3667 domain-containing protein n=1 Tax=uncultured Croceitalea sp. TaxID=1798908 RepID=UPI00374EDACC
MICKTCENSLRSDFSYCPNCGGKIIRNRLTLKNIWQDLKFQVFDLDNTLFKTIKHLFTKPEVVIESFISGARKKYMNPISFFAIAITLSGVLFFVLRDIYHINLTESSFNPENASTPNMDFVIDYQAIISYLLIPVYALMTWILFLDKRKLNYTEHLITNAYTTGQISFVQVILGLIVFSIFEFRYDIFNWIFLTFSIGYQFYVLKRAHKIGAGSAILRAFGYFFMFLIVMMGIGVLAIIIGLIFGTINLEDFIQK